MGKRCDDEIAEVREWFRRSVTYEGEAYVMDDEQIEAVIDVSKNAIVVARAGSGKTRTIVAKIVYLIARCGVKPDEIMAFVFNSNAASEINMRLTKMCVDGIPVVGGGLGDGCECCDETCNVEDNCRGGKIGHCDENRDTVNNCRGVKIEYCDEAMGVASGRNDDGDRGDDKVRGSICKENNKHGECDRDCGAVRIASTFHAFSRKIVYDVCNGKGKCGRILAGEKERFVMAVVVGMMKEPRWEVMIRRFIGGDDGGEMEQGCSEDISGAMMKMREGEKKGLDERELYRFAKMMTLFVNRAQQKFLAGKSTLWKSIKQRYKNGKVGAREKDFIQLGAECYRRYHWYLLDENERRKLGADFSEYGTDFNLIVSWASKLIAGGNKKVVNLLGGVKYVLIDEYQDFSQLFLSVVMAIRNVAPDVKLFVVGDDWQAINRFAGSDVEYFSGFEEYFPEDVRRLPIATNYRCNYAIVDTARTFMKKGMEERGEFRAFSRRAGRVVVANPALTRCEYALVDYDKRVSGRDRIYMSMAKRMLGRMPKRKTVRYIKTLIQIIRKNKKAMDILLLHRNNETNLEGMSLMDLRRGMKWGLERLGVMDGEVFDEKIRIMTMHKSKGLEAEVVIILEADEGVIPKSHPDTRLYTIFGETDKVALSDQKRLFYVAMTRAKKRLYIIHDETTGEGFVKYLGGGVDRWGE